MQERQAEADQVRGQKAWILVAGTGLLTGVPLDVSLTAAAVGDAIARHGFGLVTGGWHGVDYLTAKAYAEVHERAGNRLEDRLIQVVRNDRPIVFEGGRIVRTEPGPLEWLEPQSYCDATILIGGLGGTYGAFLSALQKGLPQFPLGGTGGDAARAFSHMCELWGVMSNPGITKVDFEALGRPVSSAADAAALADTAMRLVKEAVTRRSGDAPKSVFISYSRRDITWLHRVAAVLAPLEQHGRVKVWSDTHIEAGEMWEAEIRRKMATCDVAVLLVSEAFLASEFVQAVELPTLTEAARTSRTRLLWVAVTEGLAVPAALNGIQAVVDPTTPLSTMNAADVQVALVQLRRAVAAVTGFASDPGNIEELT